MSNHVPPIRDPTTTGVISSQPANLNTARENRFRVVFRRLPNVQFWTQSVQVPPYTVNFVEQPTPYGKIPLPADVNFTEWQLNFRLDEDFKNYRELYKWMRATTNDGSSDFYDKNSLHSDATVMFTNSEGKETQLMVFQNVIPGILSGFDMNYTGAPPAEILVNASFKYMRHEFVCP